MMAHDNEITTSISDSSYTHTKGQTEKITPEQSDVTPTVIDQKEIDFLNITSEYLKDVSKIKLRKLLVEAEKYWDHYKKGILKNIEAIVENYMILLNEIHKRKMIFPSMKDFDRFIRHNVRTGESGKNIIPLEVVLEHIEIASVNEKKKIKDILVKIDFKNGDCMHFFKHLARAIAI